MPIYRTNQKRLCEKLQGDWKLHLDPFFGLWTFLRRTSTQSYRRIEVNPLAPWRVHEKSQT
jgi:hypothetical protein